MTNFIAKDVLNTRKGSPSKIGMIWKRSLTIGNALGWGEYLIFVIPIFKYFKYLQKIKIKELLVLGI